MAKRSKRSKGRGKPRRSRQGGRHVVSPYSRQVRCPTLPKEYSVAISVQGFVNQNAVTAEVFVGLGLVEFLNVRPLYCAQFYTFYKYCKITAVHVTLDVVNTGTVAINAAIGVMSATDVATTLFDSFVEKPGTVRKILSTTGGMDRQRLSKFCPVQRWIGSQSGPKYWVNSAQSLSATPIDSEEPIIVLGFDNFLSSAAPFSVAANYRLTYHCQFFDLETPAAS